MTDKFIMVSLDEEKAKKLAEVISNDTARKILDYLSDKNEATVSEISKELGIAISTTDYNIKNLIENGLVESKEFKWSSKGRQMDIYRLANKHIIISTKKNAILRDKLKDIFAILISGAGVAWLINHFYKPVATISKTIVKETVVNEISEGAEKTSESLAAAAQYAAHENTTRVFQDITSKISLPNVALWFFLGVIFAIIIYLIIDWRLKK